MLDDARRCDLLEVFNDRHGDRFGPACGSPDWVRVADGGGRL
jgi:hypothetical protein